MRVFMLGWEFPPFISGGLGTACYGLTKAMGQLNMQVTFVLPKVIDSEYMTHVKLLNPSSLASDPQYLGRKAELERLKNVSVRAIDSPLQPYLTPASYQGIMEKTLLEKQRLYFGGSGFPRQFGSNLEMGRCDYSGDMFSEVHRYASIAADLAMNEDFDVVHAHDWMTYPAGIIVSALKKKPLVVHVHSTEFDRSGEHVNQMIYDIERSGMHAASKVIAVSFFTRNIIINRYGVSGDKVEVVHNGVDRNGPGEWPLADSGIEKDEKIVLFVGRITMQKGPEYFLHAAKKVLEVFDNVKFVMAGSGDMMYRMVELAAQLGIGSKVLFTGFLHGEAVQKIYRMADLFVMPSVSEPFGLVPLEALDNDVPVIISRQSGVSEVLTHALKVDFWDINEIANKIVAVLKYPPLQTTLKNFGNFEVRKLRWEDSAAKCAKIYEEAMVSV